MNITTGHLKGRPLRAAGTHRPTKDKVRQAIFNVLADRVAGARVLDLFAGTGALGLEAFSRGAQRVDFVEQDRSACAALHANLAALGGAATPAVLRAHREDALSFVRRCATRGQYDLVLADPPYVQHDDQRNWASEILTAVDQSPLLAPQGVLVLELKHGQSLCPPVHLRPFLDRIYGHTRVVMCTNAPPATPEVAP
jgi:16S rRNA (guanine966-N2)-methyltransferase